ncbi:MAG: 4Fe-4S dicluster domain-containing protein [Deltaproteobacteria bacterium]|nr:MAG: 4Fe-4S dicluster domain-containing protein [Deltaproteobacteria bacterium]
MSRRKFLGWLTAAGLSSSTFGKVAHAATTKHFEGHPKSLGVLYDNTSCIGCRTCEAACNKVNDLPLPDRPFDDLAVLDNKRRTDPKKYMVINKYDNSVNAQTPLFARTGCNHCLEPACASSCFVRAYTKTESGAVTYDESVCVGCRYCMLACPFNIPTFEYDSALTPRIRKCTMCYDNRLVKSELPGCIEACPTESFTFGKRTDLLKIGRERIRRYPGRYLDHIYGENEMGGTSWLYLSGVPFRKIGMREDLGIIPAPQFTSSALAAVPMVVGTWPLLLMGIYAVSRRKDKIAKEEKEQALAEVIAQAKAEADQKVSEAWKKAAQEKEKAIEAAVKKALEAAADTETEENS